MAGVVIFLAAVATWVLLFSPPLDDMFRQLQSCPASEITQVRIHDLDSTSSGSSPSVVMTGGQAATFMRMISKAERAFPNHPRGGSTLLVEVDTKRWGTRYLQISATDNCGVLIYLDSKKVGTGSSWESGPFRNDELIAIFSNYGQGRRGSPPSRR